MFRIKNQTEEARKSINNLRGLQLNEIIIKIRDTLAVQLFATLVDYIAY